MIISLEIIILLAVIAVSLLVITVSAFIICKIIKMFPKSETKIVNNKPVEVIKPKLTKEQKKQQKKQAKIDKVKKMLSKLGVKI